MKKTQKKDLLERHDLKYIQKTWVEHGMYKAGELLECNPWTVYYLARINKWKRQLPEFLVKAYNKGEWKLTNRYYIERNNKNE